MKIRIIQRNTYRVNVNELVSRGFDDIRQESLGFENSRFMSQKMPGRWSHMLHSLSNSLLQLVDEGLDLEARLECLLGEKLTSQQTHFPRLRTVSLSLICVVRGPM